MCLPVLSFDTPLHLAGSDLDRTYYESPFPHLTYDPTVYFNPTATAVRKMAKTHDRGLLCNLGSLNCLDHLPCG